MKYLIKNGVLVSGMDMVNSDILIDDGIIKAVGEDLDEDDTEVIDAEGCYVFPGFIDAHTHLDMESAAGMTADNFYSGTRAALAGGTTTIIDFATQDRGSTLQKGLEKWCDKAKGRSACDYGFHMAITEWTDDMPEQMAEMCRRGVTSFKVYLAYDHLRLTSDEIRKVLEVAKNLGAVVSAHCENGDQVNEGIRKQKTSGHLGPSAHPLSRPNYIEAEAIETFLSLAEEVGASVYVVHLSKKEGLQVIRDARARGQNVWAETCPQYLIFNDKVYERPGFEGAKYVCSPPIRSNEDREALREAVKLDEIQVIATDHCSFRFKGQKDIGRMDFSAIPNGLPGIEDRPSLIYTLSDGACEMSPMQICRILSENPAKIFGMYPRKGSLEIGSDADLVIWNPLKQKKISAENQIQNVDYNPYEGMIVLGTPEMVILRGLIVVENGKVIERCCGEYVHRRGFSV